jgi:phosphotransferase system  glucose/maltose/N-acetylglucosamine-specific IIC component
MDGRHLTILFIAVAFLGIVAYDVWVMLTYGVQDTISDVIRGWGRTYPLTPWLLGAAMFVLWCHFYARPVR